MSSVRPVRVATCPACGATPFACVVDRLEGRDLIDLDEMERDGFIVKDTTETVTMGECLCDRWERRNALPIPPTKQVTEERNESAVSISR